MSVIIRLQGLPWSASAMDIRNFFKGLSIPPGGVRIIGGDNGDAFIAFSTDEDARQAMMLNNKTLNDSPVQLFLSSKTEMQNTITQAKVKAPATVAPTPAAAQPVTTNLGISLSQIPSVQQISQAFPAVGQLIGQLGLQPQSQMNQLQSGLQTNMPQSSIAPLEGFTNNSNVNSSQAAKDILNINRFEQEFPGEYSVGGMPSDKGLGERSGVHGQYGQGDSLKPSFNNLSQDPQNRRFPQAQRNFENTSQKDQFRGEVYFPQKSSQKQPWDINYQPPHMSNFAGNAGHGKPFNGEQGHPNSQQFGHGKPFQGITGVMNNQQSDFLRQSDNQSNQLSEFSVLPRGHSNQNFSQTGRQSGMAGVSQQGDSNIPPRTRQSRFAPAVQPNESRFQNTVQPNNKASEPVKMATSLSSDTRDKFQPHKSTTDAKSHVPSGNLILSNKRDEFGRNLPYTGRDENLSEVVKTPTQDEKSEDSRLRDSKRRTSRDRDRSRERSSRRDSPRDRRDRDRDRSRRDREDDRKSRRDRDRERKPRDRDSDKYERSRDSKEPSISNSPVGDLNRKSRKRSLSPNSKNKNDNEKKQQTEKSGVDSGKLSDKKENTDRKPFENQVSVSQSSVLSDKPTVSSDNKKPSTGGQPLFPIIPPPKSGKGILGEAPPHLAPVSNINITRNEGLGPGGPSLHGASSQGRMPLIQDNKKERMPPNRMVDQPQTFEYGHSAGVMGQSSTDIPVNNRPDFRGPRDEPINAPSSFRGTGRGGPPPAFMDNQQRPGFNRGPRGPLDSQPRPYLDQPANERRGGPLFDERHPRDLRGPPQGRGGPPGRDMPHPGPNQGPYGGESREFQGRRSLLGDGGPPRNFQGPPGPDSFHDNQAFSKRGPPIMHGQPDDFNDFQGPFDDRRRKDNHRVPSLLDDVPFRGTREFQGRQGIDVPQGDFIDESQYQGRQEHDFLDDDNYSMVRASFRGDQGFDEFGHQRGFRGRGVSDRAQQDFRGPPIGGRDYQGQDIERMPDQMHDINRGRDSFRMQSERDIEHRAFDRDRPSTDHERGGFDRRDRFDERDRSFSGRYQDNNFSRDRSVDRPRHDRRDDRIRERQGDKNEDGRMSFREERTSSDSSVRRSNRGDERFENRKSTVDINERQDQQNKEDSGGIKSNDSKGQSEADTQKATALCSVVLENIPVETTYKDIRRLFSGLELPKDGIKILNDEKGNRIGKAYVRFGSQDSFKKGLQKDRTRLGNKLMVIKPVPRKEFDSAIDSYIPPSEDDNDDGPVDLDMCHSLSATLRALKGEPELKISKKTPAFKDFVVKMTLLPEYTKPQNIKSFFKGLDIAQNGDAIYIEPGQLNKPCSGVCYVEFADENSYKKALTHRRVFERKTIHIAQGNKKDIDELTKKIKKETESNKDSKNAGTSTKQNNKDEVKDNAQSVKPIGVDSSQNISKDNVKTDGKKDADASSAELVKTQNEVVPSACTCLRIQNIPKGIKVFELRGVFEGTGINVKVSQICHDAVGKPVGEGFLELSSSIDVEKCLVKNNTYIGKNKITVKPVTKAEMIESMRLLRQSLQPEVSTTKAVYFFIKASNLPKTVSTGEIMNFFSGYNPAPESIRLNIGDGSEPQDCSTALVGFRTREEAETAIAATNGNILRDKNVELSKVKI